MLEMINFILTYGQVCYYMVKKFLEEKDCTFMKRLEAKF